MNYSEIKAYVESMANHNEINTAIFGSIDELLGGLRTYKNVDYPLLFVPEYSVSPQENQADYRFETITMLFTLYQPFPKNAAHADRHQILAELEPIIRDVAGKICEDIENESFPVQRYHEFQLQGPNISEPVGTNRLIGYALELSFIQTASIRHRPEMWA